MGRDGEPENALMLTSFPVDLHVFLFPLQAMKVVSDKRAKDATEKLQKEKELSKIKVSKEDVDLIVRCDFSEGFATKKK